MVEAAIYFIANKGLQLSQGREFMCLTNQTTVAPCNPWPYFAQNRKRLYSKHPKRPHGKIAFQVYLHIDVISEPLCSNWLISDCAIVLFDHQ